MKHCYFLMSQILANLRWNKEKWQTLVSECTSNALSCRNNSFTSVTPPCSLNSLLSSETFYLGYLICWFIPSVKCLRSLISCSIRAIISLLWPKHLWLWKITEQRTYHKGINFVLPQLHTVRNLGSPPIPGFPGRYRYKKIKNCSFLF